MHISFQKHGVNLVHIESRPAKDHAGHYAFFVSCDDSKGGLHAAIDELRPDCTTLSVLSRSVTAADEDSGIYKRGGTILFSNNSMWMIILTLLIPFCGMI